MLTLYPSIELDTTLKIRIGHSEGSRETLPYSAIVESPTKASSFMGSRMPTSLIVEAQVYGGASPISVPMRTAYKPPAPAHRASSSKSHQWNEWLEMPVLISQSPLDACVLFTIWGPSGKAEPAVYCSAVLPLFARNRSLQQGRQKLAVTLDTPPQKLVKPALAQNQSGETSSGDSSELDRLEKSMKKHQMGEIPRIDWLDNLVFRKIESITVEENMSSDKQHHYSFVESPLWEHDVVWMVRHYADATKSSGAFSNSQQLSTSVSSSKPMNRATKSKRASKIQPAKNVRTRSPSILNVPSSNANTASTSNVEDKKDDAKMAGFGSNAAHLAPAPSTMVTPNSGSTTTTAVSGTESSSEDTSNYNAAVFSDTADGKSPNIVSNNNINNGSDPIDDEEEEENLMAVYDPDFGRETPIEAKYRRLVRLANNDRDMRPTAKIRDELERIMRFSPVHELSSDDKILLWKYRYYLTKRKNASTKFVKSVSWDDEIESSEAVEVLNIWVDIDVADALESLGPEVKNAQVRAYAVDRSRTASDHDLELYSLQLVEASKFEPWVNTPAKSYLARFLESRVILNPSSSNNFYWYVSVQATDRQYGAAVYQPILRHYLSTLPQTSSQIQQIQQRIAAVVPSGTTIPQPITLKQIKAQVKFMNKSLDLTTLVKQSKEPRPRRIQQMRAWLADPRNEMIKFKPTISPSDPSVTAVGCIPEQCLVFKSSMSPLKIVSKTINPTTMEHGTYAMSFKSGDDLRQDQLVMQIIQLMDELLRKENLDLKLTPYRILATSMTDGAMEFIPNEPISHVISQHHGISPFLRMHAADPNEPLGVRADVMDNFVRSSAGYAVITYILGVGDRHLENLLIDFEGHFFHIDFGYILGKDPKPFPPMIKLPIQSIDGMGGINSDNYRQFRSYCFTAFTTSRKSANLILALFNLMTESTIPNIALERDQAVSKVEERFCLEMTDEEAILHFQNLINDSVNAFSPMVIDRLHSMAQYWRA